MNIIPDKSRSGRIEKKVSLCQKEGMAFTVTELLFAAVTVIALLGLAYPVYKGMGQKSHEAACTNNLRTLASGALNYIHDRGGRLFPSKYWYSPSWDASPGMRDYVISSTNNRTNAPEFMRDTVFTCPELKRIHPAKYPAYLNRNYTLNWLAFETNPVNGNPTDDRPKRLANIPSLSGMWMFTDGSFSDPAIKESYGVWLRRSDLANNNAAANLAFAHSGRQNTVFFDGHVEPVSKASFYTPRSIRQFWGEVTARD